MRGQSKVEENTPVKRSVVTAERFASGHKYTEYLAKIRQNRERFEQYHAAGLLLAGDEAFFRLAGQSGLSRILVISEDWCPYAVRGVPVVERIASAAGAEMRIFPRDENLDIMKEFLLQDKFMSIPVAVFYTDGLKEICRWIERPGLVDLDRQGTQKRKADAAGLAEQTQSKRPDWQQEAAREMRILLAAKLEL
jgi:hypothetical protein